MRNSYQWVQGDHETIEADLTTLDGASPGMDLTGRTAHFVLRHCTGAKIADEKADLDGTIATVELTPDNLSRSGAHEAEWRITGGSDDPTTLPKESPIDDIDVRKSVDAPDDVAGAILEDPAVNVLTANGLAGPLVGNTEISSLVGGNLDNRDGTLVADVTDTNTQLSPSAVRDIIAEKMVAPSVPTEADLPAAADSTDEQLYWVDDKQRYYRYEAQA